MQALGNGATNARLATAGFTGNQTDAAQLNEVFNAYLSLGLCTGSKECLSLNYS
ncbi:MAG: hypothetical protein V3U65_14095 [Granulosicoccaceae bacterium]